MRFSCNSACNLPLTARCTNFGLESAPQRVLLGARNENKSTECRARARTRDFPRADYQQQHAATTCEAARPLSSYTRGGDGRGPSVACRNARIGLGETVLCDAIGPDRRTRDDAHGVGLRLDTVVWVGLVPSGGQLAVGERAVDNRYLPHCPVRGHPANPVRSKQRAEECALTKCPEGAL